MLTEITLDNDLLWIRIIITTRDKYSVVKNKYKDPPKIFKKEEM